MTRYMTGLPCMPLRKFQFILYGPNRADPFKITTSLNTFHATLQDSGSLAFKVTHVLQLYALAFYFSKALFFCWHPVLFFRCHTGLTFSPCISSFKTHSNIPPLCCHFFHFWPWCLTFHSFWNSPLTSELVQVCAGILPSGFLPQNSEKSRFKFVWLQTIMSVGSVFPYHPALWERRLFRLALCALLI